MLSNCLSVRIGPLQPEFLVFRSLLHALEPSELLKMKTAPSARHKGVRVSESRWSRFSSAISFVCPSLLTLRDSITLLSAVQAAFGPRKGLNLPAALDFVAFFLSENADDRQI